MKIGVSLGCFYYWDSKHNLDNKLKYISLLKDLNIDAMELHFTEEEILNKQYNKFLGLIDNYILTVHLPKIIINNEFFDNLKEMSKTIHVKHFILHTNQYNGIKSKLKGINIILENNDKRDKKFNNLQELKETGENICLDVEHFEESFPGQINNKISIIKNKIKELHISATNNKFYKYSAPNNTTHYLTYGSDYKIPKCLPKKAIWMIEGVIPKNRLDLLKKEIKILRSS